MNVMDAHRRLTFLAEAAVEIEDLLLDSERSNGSVGGIHISPARHRRSNTASIPSPVICTMPPRLVTA